MQTGQSSIIDHDLKRDRNPATKLNSRRILHRRYGDLPRSNILQQNLLFHPLRENIQAAVPKPMHLEFLRVEQYPFHADGYGHLVDDGIVEMQDLVYIVILPLGQTGDLVEPILPNRYRPVELGVSEGLLGLESAIPPCGRGQRVFHFDSYAILEGWLESGAHDDRGHLHVALD
jgi:hypothetical protein